MFVRVVPLALLGSLCAVAAPGNAQEVPLTQLDGRRTFAATAASGDLPQVQALVETLAAAGDLRLFSSRPDPYLDGRVHDTFRQFHQGVPVLGGGISRQAGAAGALSVFGTLHEDIDVDVTPGVPAGDAVALLQASAGVRPATTDLPELVILPTLAGGYALAWSVVMDDFHQYFLDAHSGAVVERQPLFRQQQASVGSGHGIRGVEKKVSVSQAGGRFEARDRLRPAEIVTLDARLDEERTLDLLLPLTPWSASDVASSTGNTWSDPALVDAHAYTGFTYDHLFRVHGWRGADGRDGRIFSMINPGGPDLGYNNAAFFFPPLGPEGTGMYIYGRWVGGLPLTSADIVGHELMHGVVNHSFIERTGIVSLPSFWGGPGPTSFQLGERTITCDSTLTYLSGPNEGRTLRLFCADDRMLLLADHAGAVQEALCDILGTTVEFGLHAGGAGPLRADYLMGEDTGNAIRSLSDPTSLLVATDFPPEFLPPPDSLPPFVNPPLPAAYDGILRFLIGLWEDDPRGGTVLPLGSLDGETIVAFPAADSGGVHLNSTIISHAFYLAVEGGRNATTGLTVTGSGDLAAVERAFFRAATELMPQGTSMAGAADIIRLSAFQMYGIDSPIFQAIHQAFTAVGLPLQIS